MCPTSNITMNQYSIIMKKTAIFGIFLLTSLLTGTVLNMNMFSSALAAMGGQGIIQYDYKNANQPIYKKDPYAKSYDNSYNYDNKSNYGKDPYAKNYDNKSNYGKDPYAKSYDNSYNHDNKSNYGKDPYAKSYNYNNEITIINQPT